MAIGYACIALGVEGAKLRTCTLKNATEERLNDIIGNNLEALARMLDYNIQHSIHLYRISSDIIPFGSHKINKLTWWETFATLLKELGTTINQLKMRVSMHPGQYTVLNSPDDSIVKAAIADLEYHARFLKALDVDYSHKIILHIGGIYGNRKEAMQRFISNFGLLSPEVQSRLVIENDEKYAVDEILKIAGKLGVPAVFDVLHHQVNAPDKLREINEWITLCRDTWQVNDGRQKIHYSQREPGLRIGAHSRTVKVKEFINFYNLLPDNELDIMLEVKDKNLSAIKCLHAVNPQLSNSELEGEWNRYKYLVMEHSPELYEEIRQYLSFTQKAYATEMYTIIEKALEIPATKGSQLKAAEHIWDSLKTAATPRERGSYLKKVQGMQDGTVAYQSLKKMLHKLSKKYNRDLHNSYYFIWD